MHTPFAERVAHVRKINGSEALVMHNGSRYIIVTPDEKKAGRSLSLDLGVIDEAFAQENLALVGALAPTMAARPHAQLWILSNAGTFRSGAVAALHRHRPRPGRRPVVDAVLAGVGRRPRCRRARPQGVGRTPTRRSTCRTGSRRRRWPTPR